MIKQESINAKVVWGKIITYLREHHLSALHIACGDIKDVKIEGDNLVVSTDQEYLFQIISKQENVFEIKNALSFLGLNLKPVVKLLDKPSVETEADLLVLKEMFGEYLKIK